MSIENLPDYVRTVQDAWIRQLARGIEPQVIPDYEIERDKRSRARVIRELQGAGFIGEALPQEATLSTAGERFPIVTARVLASIEARRPDFVDIVNTQAVNLSPHGLAFDERPREERIYMVQNADEYTATWSNGSRTVAGRLGERPPRETYTGMGAWGWTLYVTDAALAEKQAATAREKRIADLFRGNLPQALRLFAKVPEADSKGWGIGEHDRDGAFLFGEGVSKAVGPDPATWEADVRKISAKSWERVRAAVAEHQSILRVIEAVTQAGGWERLGAELRAAVEGHVDAPAPPPLAVGDAVTYKGHPGYTIKGLSTDGRSFDLDGPAGPLTTDAKHVAREEASS